MKNLKAIAITILAACMLKPSANGKEYSKMTIVTDVDYVNDVVTVTDVNGYMWQFDGTNDWFENDICTCVMNDNGTELIYDDYIVSTHYDGWINLWIEKGF